MGFLKLLTPKGATRGLAYLAADHPWKVIVGAAMLTVLLGAGLLRYEPEANNEDFLQRYDLAARTRLLTDFEGVRKPVFVFAEARAGNLLDPTAVVELAEVEQALRGNGVLAPLLGGSSIVGPHTLIERALEEVNRLMRDAGAAASLEELRRLLEERAESLPAAAPHSPERPAAFIHQAADVGMALLAPLMGMGRPAPPGYEARLRRGELRLSDLGPTQIDALLRAALWSMPEARELFSRDLDLRADRLRAGSGAMVVFLEVDALADPNDPAPHFEVIDVLEGLPQRAVALTAISDRGFDKYLNRDMEENIPLLGMTALIVATVLALALRRVLDAGLPLLLFAVANVWMFGAAGHLGFRFSLVIFAAPILVLSLGVDYALHVIARYREEQRLRGSGPRAALRGALLNGGGALFLSAVTTMLGFAANGTSDIRAISEFGLTLSFGLAASFILLAVVGPTVRYMVDRRRESRAARGEGATPEPCPDDTSPTGLERLMERAARRIVTHATLILIVAVALTVAAVAAATGLDSSYQPSEGLRSGSPVLAALDRMEENLPATLMRDVEILVEGDVASPAAVGAVAAFVDNLRDDKYVVLDADRRPRVRTYLDVLGGPEAAVRIAASDPAKIGALLREAHAASVAEPEDAERVSAQLHLTDDGRIDAAVVRVMTLGGLSGTEAQDRIAAEIEQDLLPLREVGLGVVVGGEPVILGKVNRSIVRALVSGTALTLGVCLVLLCLAFASIRYGLLGIIPVTLVMAWLAGFVQVMGYSLNMATVLVVTMGIGIGLDFAIHILHRYIEERGNGLEPADATAEALSRLAAPVVAATLTTALGIGVLIFATQDFFVRFAVLTVAAIAMAFVASLVVLPPLLVRFEKVEAVQALYARICHCPACSHTDESHASECSCGHHGSASEA